MSQGWSNIGVIRDNARVKLNTPAAMSRTFIQALLWNTRQALEPAGYFVEHETVMVNRPGNCCQRQGWDPRI